jgi:hypothetical protein
MNASSVSCDSFLISKLEMASRTSTEEDTMSKRTQAERP